MSSWLSIGLGARQYDIPEEELEELRMTSTLEPEEICRLKKAFAVYTNGSDKMTKDMFMDIPCVRINPLRERVATVFGYAAPSTTLDFLTFLVGVALFNSHGKREDKLKLAFRLQDFDDDGIITKPDLILYLETVTGQPTTTVPGWDGPAIVDVVDQVFGEIASDDKRAEITILDFMRCMQSTDFHTKLQMLF